VGTLRLYHAGLEKEVRKFYERTWKTTRGTRESFKEIGIKLTDYALANVPLLTGKEETDAIYAAPVAKAGVGLFRPAVVEKLRARSKELGVEFCSFGIGASRPHENLDSLPAEVYWNTLRTSGTDLSNAMVMLYEMGEATGSTLEGIVNELRKFNLRLENLILLAGAACIDQTRDRLERVAPGMNIVYGSRWRYIEKPDPRQFYLYKMYLFQEDRWIELCPKDWGRCVSGLKDRDAVNSFIEWMTETIVVPEEDQKMLHERWIDDIHTKTNTRSKKSGARKTGD